MISYPYKTQTNHKYPIEPVHPYSTPTTRRSRLFLGNSGVRCRRCTALSACIPGRTTPAAHSISTAEPAMGASPRRFRGSRHDRLHNRHPARGESRRRGRRTRRSIAISPGLATTTMVNSRTGIEPSGTNIHTTSRRMSRGREARRSRRRNQAISSFRLAGLGRCRSRRIRRLSRMRTLWNGRICLCRNHNTRINRNRHNGDISTY